MAKPNIVVVGASAGGVEALKKLAAGLPGDFPAAVFVVLHVGQGRDGQSMLPDILNQVGPLPAMHPHDFDKIRPGRIYVAKPDFHMLVEDSHIRMTKGPKENRTRPAINPLFRTAAQAYGKRVIGVILTGLLDDGVAGLAEVKRGGGVTVVQNPETALFPDMPASALEHVTVDHVTELKDLGPLLSALTGTDASKEDHVSAEETEPKTRTLTKMTCPECHGPIWVEHQGRIIEYRCRVGHAYSPLNFAQDTQAMLERSVWTAIIALEDAAEIAEEIGENGSAQQAGTHRGHAGELRSLLQRMLANQESTQ